MRTLRIVLVAAIVLGAAVASARAQTAPNLSAIRLLLPMSTLLNTPAGRAALKSNLEVTGAIQAGTAPQPTLEPPAAQR